LPSARSSITSLRVRVRVRVRVRAITLTLEGGVAQGRYTGRSYRHRVAALGSG
jgi:hypothetical protein